MLRSVIVQAAAIVAGFLLAQPAAAQFTDSVEVLFELNAEGGQFGWAVSELGDVDFDGVGEFIVGSRSLQGGVVYSGASGQVLFELKDSGTAFGFAIADAGDVNNDGVTDVIGGAPLLGAGRVAVFSGKDGSVIWNIPGASAGERFGAAVSTADDINQDGFDDFMVGADAGSGAVRIYSGADGELLREYLGGTAGARFGSGTATVADLNDDDVDEHVIGAFGAGSFGQAHVHDGRSGDRLFILNADSGGAAFGQFFVAGMGDVNADGTADIYVGDYAHASQRGRAYVFSGADQSVLHRFNGGTGEGAGPGRSAGDVNGDGHDDVIVGFYTSSLGGNRAGRVAVYSGADGTELEGFVHTPAGSNLGFDAVGVGDLNGDNRLDFLLSAANANRVYVAAGSTVRQTGFALHAGLNGSWFNPETSGQGFFLDVFGGRGEVFLGWYTFDTAAADGPDQATVGDPGQRWLTAQGPFTGATAPLTITLTRDGRFDDPRLTENTPVGEAVLTFADCARGEFRYRLDDSGLSGRIPLQRLSNDNVALCKAMNP